MTEPKSEISLFANDIAAAREKREAQEFTKKKELLRISTPRYLQRKKALAAWLKFAIEVIENPDSTDAGILKRDRKKDEIIKALWVFSTSPSDTPPSLDFFYSTDFKQWSTIYNIVKYAVEWGIPKNDLEEEAGAISSMKLDDAYTQYDKLNIPGFMGQRENRRLGEKFGAECDQGKSTEAYEKKKKAFLDLLNFLFQDYDQKNEKEYSKHENKGRELHTTFCKEQPTTFWERTKNVMKVWMGSLEISLCDPWKRSMSDEERMLWILNLVATASSWNILEEVVKREVKSENAKEYLEYAYEKLDCQRSIPVESQTSVDELAKQWAESRGGGQYSPPQ